jgi:hypothetical protein
VFARPAIRRLRVINTGGSLVAPASRPFPSQVCLLVVCAKRTFKKSLEGGFFFSLLLVLPIFIIFLSYSPPLPPAPLFIYKFIYIYIYIFFFFFFFLLFCLLVANFYSGGRSRPGREADLGSAWRLGPLLSFLRYQGDFHDLILKITFLLG